VHLPFVYIADRTHAPAKGYFKSASRCFGRNICQLQVKQKHLPAYVTSTPVFPWLRGILPSTAERADQVDTSAQLEGIEIERLQLAL